MSGQAKQHADLAAHEVMLVEQARAGRKEAFAELVTRYQRRAVSVAYRLLGNIDDARDISQDAFVKAYQSLGQLEDPARFGAWLLRVVSNLSLNYRRARSLRSTGGLDEGMVDGAVRTTDGTGFKVTGGAEDEGVMSKELRSAMERALEQLPEKQRLALILFSVEGLPQREVADVLECSVELVKWNVFQARKKLKELLADYL